MTITIVREDSHGVVVVAVNDEAAKRALIETNWIASYSNLWDEEAQDYKQLDELYGDEWEKAYMAMNREQLADMGFFFRTEEVWE